MNPSEKNRGRATGPALEWRVGRLYFWSGQFSRTGIDLREHFHPEPMTLTDLDLLAFNISNLLSVEKTIGESKSGTGKSTPKPLDRTFWLSGLLDYTDASAAVLAVSTNVSREVRSVGDKLGVRILTESELGTIEQDLGVDTLDYGSYASELRTLWDDIRSSAKHDVALERAWKFLRADMWHLEPWLALKRSIAMLSVVSKRWIDGLSEAESRLLEALLVEGSVVFSLAAVRVAGELRWLPAEQTQELLTERLGEGLAPTAQLVKLSKAVDRYIVSLLDELNASESAKVKAMGAFSPKAPDWAEPFQELAQRLGREGRVAKEIPRTMDVSLYENILRKRVVSKEAVDALHLEDEDGTFRLARLIAVFLVSHAGVPRFIFDGLGVPAGTESTQVARRDVVSSEESLFDVGEQEEPGGG